MGDFDYHLSIKIIPSADRDYNGPWRNRGYTFYIQMCYRDELTGKWAKLRALLDKHQLAFDDYWIYYYPKKKKPEERPTAARRPLWQELDERFGVTSKSKGYD